VKVEEHMRRLNMRIDVALFHVSEAPSILTRNTRTEGGYHNSQHWAVVVASLNATVHCACERRVTSGSEPN